MQNYTHVHTCRSCNTEEVDHRRWQLGYKTCLDCAELDAIQARKSWCVAPMHKSNYMLITSPELLHGLNNKGGLIK
jgi:hypothetical protein